MAHENGLLLIINIIQVHTLLHPDHPVSKKLMNLKLSSSVIADGGWL